MFLEMKPKDSIDIRMIFYYILSLLTFSTRVVAVEINNGILGMPQISCMQHTMQLTFATEDVFSGRIYVKGRVSDPDCSKKIVRDKGASDVTFVVPLGQCGMQRIRNFDPAGMNMMITVVISFHLIFVTKVDRAYRLQCLFRPSAGKSVTQTLDVSQLPTTPLAAMGGVAARCDYSIRRGHVDGPKLRFASVGEKAYHVWQCTAGEGNYGILVYGCQATDAGSTEPVNIVDSRGCTVDPVLIEPVQYDSSSPKAWAVTHVFKYSDQSVISFQCDIKICSRDTDQCESLTPPECSRDDSFMRRKGKSRKVRQANSSEEVEKTLGITVAVDGSRETQVQSLQMGVTSDEILVFDPNLLDYGLASQLEETLGLPKMGIDDDNVVTRTSATMGYNYINLAEKTTQPNVGFDQYTNINSLSSSKNTVVNTDQTGVQVSAYTRAFNSHPGGSHGRLTPRTRFHDPARPPTQTGDPTVQPICIPHDMFAVMMTSTLLSFIIATLFMTLVFARLITYMWIHARSKPHNSFSVRSMRWTPMAQGQQQTPAPGPPTTLHRISPSSTWSSAWSRHALPPSWQQHQRGNDEQLSSYFATIHK